MDTPPPRGDSGATAMRHHASAIPFAVFLAATACAVPVASAQSVVPDAVRTRIDALVATCVRAGGELGDMDGQGRFVIPADFNGDGHTDFVVSEGNVPCTGQPDLFRDAGLARVELHLGTGTAASRLVFADRLLAYRVVAGSPARLQIARRGEGCGAGSGQGAQCGAELRWNAAKAGFDEVPTGRRGGAAEVGVRPAVVAGGAAPDAVAGTAPGDGPASGAVQGEPAAGPSAAPLPVVADARAAHLAQCRADHQRNYPQMTAADVDNSCGYFWEKVEAAGPLAAAVLAAVPARPGERVALADLRARVPAVSLSAGRPVAGAPTPVATGRFGALDAWVDGNAQAATALTFRWGEVGGDPPYDLPGALAARGARVEPLGCYHYGVSEVNAVHLVDAPGRPPFAITVYTRGAPTGQAIAHQTLQVALDGVLPTRAGLRAEHRDPPWVDPCPI